MTPTLLFILAALTPNLNIESTCRGEGKRLPADQRPGVYNTCLQDERDARKALDAKWITFPPADRAHCAEFGRLFDSYVELKVCLDLRTSAAFSPKP